MFNINFLTLLLSWSFIHFLFWCRSAIKFVWCWDFPVFLYITLNYGIRGLWLRSFRSIGNNCDYLYMSLGSRMRIFSHRMSGKSAIFYCRCRQWFFLCRYTTCHEIWTMCIFCHCVHPLRVSCTQFFTKATLTSRLLLNPTLLLQSSSS